MKNVTNLGEKTGSSLHWSPVQALERVKQDHMPGGPLEDYKKVITISLESNGDGQYEVAYNQAGMRLSECIALLETAKALLLKQMGY